MFLLLRLSRPVKVRHRLQLALSSPGKCRHLHYLIPGLNRRELDYLEQQTATCLKASVWNGKYFLCQNSLVFVHEVKL
jgi:hypothetical protein